MSGGEFSSFGLSHFAATAFQPETISGMVNETRKRTFLLLTSKDERLQAAESGRRRLSFKSAIKYSIPVVMGCAVSIFPMYFPHQTKHIFSLICPSFLRDNIHVCFSHGDFYIHKMNEAKIISELEDKIQVLEAQRNECESGFSSSIVYYFKEDSGTCDERLTACVSDVTLDSNAFKREIFGLEK